MNYKTLDDQIIKRKQEPLSLIEWSGTIVCGIIDPVCTNRNRC